MSKVSTYRIQRIEEQINRVFGDSPQAREMKAIALKSALEGWTEEEMKQYWEEKERDLAEIKERFPVANDMCYPVESITITNQGLLSNVIIGPPASYDVNGTIRIPGQGEVDRSENSTIEHEIRERDGVERGQEVADSL